MMMLKDGKNRRLTGNRRKLVNMLFYEGPIGILQSIEDDSTTLREIGRKTSITYCHIYNLVKRLRDAGIVNMEWTQKSNVNHGRETVRAVSLTKLGRDIKSSINSIISKI